MSCFVYSDSFRNSKAGPDCPLSIFRTNGNENYVATERLDRSVAIYWVG
jgi:hypothetical protein